MMNNTSKNLLLLTTSLLILLSTCISQNNTPGAKNGASGYEVVFPMSEYLTTSAPDPYPVVAAEKLQQINTSAFINIMNYGASGDGRRADDAAIAKAFAACKDGSGIIFPKGKTFLIQNLIRVPVNKDITVYAYGAVFKMADNTGYNAIALECNANGYNNKIIWLGGLFDGNKNRQAWPGSPTGNNNWNVTQSNYGLLTIRRAKFTLVKDISIINSVYDGVDLYECELGVIADSKASGGVNLNFSKLKFAGGKGHQSTYFKCTRRNSQVVYFLNLDCKEGSIGVQYSTNTVSDSSLAVVSNCHFYNQGQDALHFESCKKIFIYKCTIGGDNAVDYHTDVHISNDTWIASVKNCQLKNGRIDFRNASKLQLGIVEDCQMESYALRKEDSMTLRTFIHNATHVKNCTFKGRTIEDGVKTKYITGSSFQMFDVALNASALVNKCNFNTGVTAIRKARGNTYINDCVFKNVGDQASDARQSNSNPLDATTLKAWLTKSISVVDERKKFLGYITQTK